MKPEEISKAINHKLREEKDDEVELWAKLLEKARHEMPGASDQKLQAIVYKWIQDIKHGKKEQYDPEMTFYPDCTISKASKAPAPPKPQKRRFAPGSSTLNVTKNSQKK